MGAVINAPIGVPTNPSATANPFSLGDTQFAIVRFIVDKVGPSAKPNKTRNTANPAKAEPPNNAAPM